MPEDKISVAEKLARLAAATLSKSLDNNIAEAEDNRKVLSNMLASFEYELNDLLLKARKKALFSVNIIDLLLRLEELSPEERGYLKNDRVRYMNVIKIIDMRDINS